MRGKMSFPRKMVDQDLNPGLDAELLLLPVIHAFMINLFLKIFIISKLHGSAEFFQIVTDLQKNLPMHLLKKVHV